MPKLVDHNAYREELLQQAFGLFARQGYGEVSMRQVADALGVSTGTLYHYFPNKETLFEQAVTLVIRRDLAQLEASVEPSDPLADKLLALFELILQERDELTSALLLTVDYYRRRPGGRMNSVVQEALEAYVDSLARLLGMPCDWCALVVAAVDGLLLQHYGASDAKGLSQGLELLRQVLVRAGGDHLPTSVSI